MSSERVPEIVPLKETEAPDEEVENEPSEVYVVPLPWKRFIASPDFQIVDIPSLTVLVEGSGDTTEISKVVLLDFTVSTSKFSFFEHENNATATKVKKVKNLVFIAILN